MLRLHFWRVHPGDNTIRWCPAASARNGGDYAGQHGPRRPEVSFVRPLARVKSHFAQHRNCHGRSYAPSIVDRGAICQCACHPIEREA